MACVCYPPLPRRGPGEGNIPEILDHAQDVADQLGLDRNHIVELKLAGNKDEELYRHLLLGQCHKLHEAMPFLFEALDDETELLLPDNLTRTDSILRGLVDSIPEEDWQQVEIIGWLYQFYISEKKDQVIGSVVKSEDIPAATQLFTPNWIVKYLVQNSVGRQWLMTYPDSNLKTQMEYYIEPAEQDSSVKAALAAITPASIEPESIKVIDPACGSGHILVEAYDLLKAIYEERGYRSRDIPKLILENNLFGLDIDDRAAQLAGFALMMKAREDDRRIFTRDIKLNVLALQSTQGLDLSELWRKLALNKNAKSGVTESIFDDAQTNLIDVVDNADFTSLQRVLVLFEQAKTFGSLIQVPADKAEFLDDLKNQLQTLVEHGDSFQKLSARALLPFVQQASLLAQRYDAVIANPPYMGGKGMNPELKVFAQKHFPDSKFDLFAMFIERGFDWCKPTGFNSMVTMQSWMFLSSFQAMREKLLATKTLSNMVHMGNGVMGIAFGTAATIFLNKHVDGYEGGFSYCKNDDINEDSVPKQFPVQNERLKTAKPDDFKKIPSSPVAYWVSENILNIFAVHKQIYEFSISEGQNITANNDKYLRLCWEVDKIKVEPAGKWSFYSKGGAYRKWFGNLDYVVDWSEDARKNYHTHPSARIIPKYLRFREGITWTLITSSNQSFRFLPDYATFDKGGSSIFFNDPIGLKKCLLFLNTKISAYLTKLFNATLNLQVDDVRKLPLSPLLVDFKDDIYQGLVGIAKSDWDYYETSWDFHRNPLIVGWDSDSATQQTESADLGLRDKATNTTYKLSNIYMDWQAKNSQIITEIQRLEQENNRLFIDAYGLQDELTPDVPLEQITLTINPKYRYGGNLSDEDLAQRFQSDTLAELIGYAIGCMMGRYRIDKPGLIYAHAGNVDFDKIYKGDTTPPFEKGGQGGIYLIEKIPPNPPFSKGGTSSLECANPFIADDDGIIPLTDQEWFKDDATNRFRDFVRTVWGEENLQLNLDFVAESLCLSALKPKKSESSLETIRRYLSTQFYKDHLKTYKKRPIYWLFSSGKQKAFECLVYLHRYNESTLSRMRTGYVTPLLGKYDAFADQLKKQLEDATSSEAILLRKELAALEKKQTELREFDDKLKHYADMRIKLDLDDGVKVNYGKFGDLLSDVKTVTGEK